MKTRILMIALMACVSGLMTQSLAQTKKEKKSTKETVVFSVPMDCEGCRTKVIGYMSYEKGVKDISANLEQQTVTIVYNPQKTTIEQLIQGFAKIDKKAVEKTACDKPCEHKSACSGHHHHDHNHNHHHDHSHGHDHNHAH
ncbi:MAG: cation transporter [Paludibacteraceae bacterium]|nr:cation transporter [Paludibacteraceae bacterium]